MDLSSYDHILVMFSGGKDSLACLLHVLEEGQRAGVDLKPRVELWHHDVDGREGSTLMDWNVTRDYCRAVGAAFGVPVYMSWKVGGFEGEMLRDKALTAPSQWENPDRTLGKSGGDRGKLSTRRRFPQVSADLSVRWCSAYLKIDIASAAIRGQARFRGKRTLVVTGERAEESSARAKYKTFEPHRSHLDVKIKRHVDAWRPVHGWSSKEVWAIIERWKVAPHPAYTVGFGRVSCMSCIFGSKDQWATVAKLDPARVEKIAAYEREFGATIQRKVSVPELVSRGKAYDYTPENAAAAMSRTFPGPAILETWALPSGAFGESCGPT